MGVLNKAATAGMKAAAAVGRPLGAGGAFGVRTAATVAGLWGTAASHPLTTTGLVLGIGSALTYGSNAHQAVPSGPASVQARPGSSGNNQFDLGASGDLVFALHRNR
jgi:hypothetical protein